MIDFEDWLTHAEHIIGEAIESDTAIAAALHAYEAGMSPGDYAATII